MRRIIGITLLMLLCTSCSLSNNEQEVAENNDIDKERGAIGVDYIMPYPDEDAGGAKDIL